MGGRGKRPSRCGGEGPANRRKRKTAAAAIQTRKEDDSPPNSDIDEPQLEDIIKMQLDLDSKSKRKRREGGWDSSMQTRLRRRVAFAGSEESEPQVMGFINSPIKVEPQVDPGEDNIQEGMLDDPSSNNQNLALDPDIDIGDVYLMRTPKKEFTVEDEGVDEEDSNKLNNQEPKTPNFDTEANVGGNGHGSTFIPKPSEGTINLPGELNRRGDIRQNILSRKDGFNHTKMDEITGLMEVTGQLDTGKGRLTNAMIPKLTSENKRLQDDNTTLRRLLTEKDEVIQKRTGEIEGLQEDLKILEDDSKASRAELDEANRKIDLLQNSISDKDSELTIFRARYLRDQEQNSQLHLAAKEGDEESVKQLIQLGADANARNNNSETPLLLAASSGGDGDVTLKIVKCLIQHGVNVVATDGAGQTFLHKFASKKNPPTSSQFHDISNYLVSKHIASLFNIRDTGNGATPIMMAARNMNLDIATISLLQTNGVNFNLVDNRGRSFLFYSKLLADPNGNLIIKHKNLAQAIHDKDEESIYHLVNLGADVNTKYRDSETPLHLAARSTNKAFSINAIKLLIDSGANVEARDAYESIFLHRFFNCAGNGKPSPSQVHEMATFLISKDLARLFNAPNGSHTPLHNAVQYVEIKGATIALLKDNGVDFNAVDDVGRSILHCATWENRTLRLISDLVAIGGANPKHLTGHCKSMLHFAAEKGRLDLLKFFVDHGLDVNARGYWGYTSLHHAIHKRENAVKIVQFLLRNGANPDIVNDDGKSPRDIVNEDRLIPESRSVSFPYGRVRDAEQIAACFSLGSSC